MNGQTPQQLGLGAPCLSPASQEQGPRLMTSVLVPGKCDWDEGPVN